MKKREIITKTVLVAALALALTGCGGKSEGTTAAASGGSKESTTAAAKDTTAETVESTETATQAVADTSANWVFKKGDLTIEMNAPADPIIQALGTAKGSYEAPSCAFDGMDVVYSYPGFEVLTYAKDGDAKISGIVLREDVYATPEGALVGMSRGEIESIYGLSGTSGSIQTEKGNCNLLFTFKSKEDQVGEEVETIQYQLVQQ